MKLIANRKDVFIIQENNKIKTIPKDTYNEVKLLRFNGSRIFYDFGNESKIQETYDNRIFNCYMGEVVINIRDSNTIARFILDDNKTGYELFFKEHYYEQHRTELLDKIIQSYGDRVLKVRNGYIVDDLFMVDLKGTSYFKSTQHGLFDAGGEHEVTVHGQTSSNRIGNEWHFLCTVAQGNFLKMSIDTEVGVLELDATTMTILAKINFLMNPNVGDNVFMNQLPNDLAKLLQEQKKGGC